MSVMVLIVEYVFLGNLVKVQVLSGVPNTAVSLFSLSFDLVLNNLIREHIDQNPTNDIIV